MDFESANPFNVRVNKISGNLLPMTADGSSFPILWKIYSCLIWLLELTQMIILIPGCMLVPKEKALKDGLIGVAVTLEVAFVVARIHMRRGLVQRMIQKLNEILCLDDEMMRYIVTTNLRSMEIPLKIYWSAGIMSVVLWSGTSLLMIFKRNSFSYVDYRMPISYGKEPISTGTFVIGSLIIMFSNMLIFTKKVAVDSYTIHLTLLITSQYRYIASKLSVIFRDKASRNDSNDSTGNKNYSTSDLSAKKEIKAVCRHHNAIVHVFRFCFIGIMVLAIPSTNLLEGYLILTYASGGVVELYILCSCVQQLLDAAAEITNKAFHQEWYLHESSVKRTFMSLIMANKLDCKLATFEKFNLSLPSLMSILNQSYSVALLILRTN
ncbi:uncharacterized protein LOC105190820 isoform X2 [Harpegnathos saltator]|uniref:uncharacterized protein LOC105190820 isoform X2 n=1 Tax=Harpegnathos saltator TaxID=610380 RepID=UPI000DBEEBF5|nr:uncharacterized protein LOC105190820 isoform X2 [Harpegnathos saltator]